MSDETTEFIFSALKANAPTPPDTITAETELELIGLGSLEVVETIFDIEEHFDITIPNPGESDDVSTDFKTAGDVVEAVKQLIALSKQS